MFFKTCTTTQEVKNEYRKLCFQYHPDTGHGNLETMKEINVAYHKALKAMDGQTVKGSDNKDHTYHYNQAVEQEIMDKIAELLAIKVQNNKDWTVELIGTWIWVSNTSREDKNLLNKNGAKMMWHGKRGMWYWKKSSYKTRYSNWSNEELRQTYGSQVFDSEKTSKAKAQIAA